MSKFTKHEVLSKLLDVGLLPTFYAENVSVSEKIVEACLEGGAIIVEFTNRGCLAYEIFGELVNWCDKEHPDAVLGTGTIVDPSTASLYINSGANFIVGPVFNPKVARICARRKVHYIPGCLTPSEISEAEEAGAHLVKLFPAVTVGHSFVKSVLGPCPWFKLMPSGGLDATREDVFAWIKAGASVLNMGSNLIRKDLVKAENFEGITELVEQCISWIKEARSEAARKGR